MKSENQHRSPMAAVNKLFLLKKKILLLILFRRRKKQKEIVRKKMISWWFIKNCLKGAIWLATVSIAFSASKKSWIFSTLDGLLFIAHRSKLSGIFFLIRMPMTSLIDILSSERWILMNGNPALVGISYLYLLLQYLIKW